MVEVTEIRDLAIKAFNEAIDADGYETSYDIIENAMRALASPVELCDCTKIQQDETCPVGYPSLLCEVCDGKGHVPPQQEPARLREALDQQPRVMQMLNAAALNQSYVELSTEQAQFILAEFNRLRAIARAALGEDGL